MSMDMDNPTINIPAVEVQVGVDEADQLDSFANATLQGTPDMKWAVSVATYVTVPEGVTKSQAGVASYIKNLLGRAAKDIPGLLFDVQVGRSLEYDVIVDEEARDRQREEEGGDDDDDTTS